MEAGWNVEVNMLSSVERLDNPLISTARREIPIENHYQAINITYQLKTC